MTSLLTLLRLLLWRTVLRDLARSLITVLGVALGVAVALAIHLANEGVLRSFSASLDHVAGKTRLQVGAGEAGFDEMWFSRIAAAPGVAQAVPVVQTVAPVAGRPGEVLLVLGVDVISEGAIREYRGPTAALEDPLRLLTDPDAILLSARYAGTHGLRIGDPIRLITPTGPKRFVVRGLLADQGAALAMDGRFAALDIAAAQLNFGKLGRLDRVDLVLEATARPERVAAALRAALPPEFVVERPEARNAQVERMLGSFQLNLFVLSLIALFVGAYLVYNAVSVSVVRQRPQIGIVRSLGASRAGVLLAVSGEGALLGLAGSLLGVGLGLLLSRTTLAMVSRTVSSLYGFVRPGPVEAPGAVILGAILLGTGISLLSSIIPALEATTVPPGQTLAAASRDRKHRPWALAGGGAVLLLMAYGLAQLGPVRGRPLFGYGASLALLLGTTLLCPVGLLAFQQSLAPAMIRTRLLGGRLAAGNLGRGLRRNGVTVGAMVVGLAMLVSVSIMIHSFRRTVEVWVDQTIRADLYLSQAGRLIKGADARLPADVLAAVRRVPGVAEADGVRSLRIGDGRGGTFVLGAGDFGLMARRGRLRFRRGDSESILLDARAHDQVIVSETFAERYRLAEGDEVVVRPPGRMIRLRIAGVYYDYTTDGGLLVMDRELFRRLWQDPWLSSVVIYLAPGIDPEAVRETILQRLSGPDGLVIFSNRALKQRILEIFDQTFAITYGLEAIALMVAVLGVLNALLASTLERTREIGILRSVGVGRGGILRSILWEAGLMGGLADLFGTLAGQGLSLILIHVINKQSFGWTIQFSFPGRLIVEYACLTLGASLVAGFFPAWRASRLPIAEAVRYE